MAGRLFILDFDRALFDTARFQQDVAEILSPGAPQAFTAAISQFTDQQTGYYSIFDQVAAQSGLSKDEVKQLLANKLPGSDYCFPDVPPWIKQRTQAGDQLMVLTVGGPDYQGLKFERAPSLAHVPKHLVKAKKGDILTAELQHQRPPYKLSFVPGSFDEIWLVDDHPNHLAGLTGLPGVTPVRVNRPGGKYNHLPNPEGVTRVITNYGELT